MQTTLTVSGTFDAAHRMVTAQYDCNRRLHGHRYNVEVTFAGPLDPVRCVVLDLEDARRCVDDATRVLDHRTLLRRGDKLLEQIDGAVVFDAEPVMETIAAWIFEEVTKLLVNTRRKTEARVERVRVSSQPDAYAEVRA